jgi:hypothetical protein
VVLFVCVALEIEIVVVEDVFGDFCQEYWRDSCVGVVKKFGDSLGCFILWY